MVKLTAFQAVAESSNLSTRTDIITNLAILNYSKNYVY